MIKQCALFLVVSSGCGLTALLFDVGGEVSDKLF